ncbi:MAG: hypothetical protein V3S66_00380 [Desulfobacterales bacterium]
MQKYVSIPARDSIPALMWFRFLDLLFLLALSGLALDLGRTAPIFKGTGFLLALLSFVLAITARRWILNWLAHRPARGFKLLQQLIGGIPENRAILAHSVLWTIVTWSVKLLAFSWLLMKFAAISWPVALLGGIAGELSSVFPIHGVAGAGTYEAAGPCFSHWESKPPTPCGPQLTCTLMNPISKRIPIRPPQAMMCSGAEVIRPIG